MGPEPFEPIQRHQPHKVHEVKPKLRLVAHGRLLPQHVPHFHEPHPLRLHLDVGSASQRMYFPKADAAVLSSRLAPPPSYPDDVGPIFDPHNAHIPCLPWSSNTQERNYPPQKEAFAPAIIPNKQLRSAERYLRACLARNERLRLSMLWYYTRDIFQEPEFLSGLQEKVRIAQESIGWECAIVGILDVNFYTRLAAIGTPLGILPRGETLCGHLVAQPPGVWKLFRFSGCGLLTLSECLHVTRHA